MHTKDVFSRGTTTKMAEGHNISSTSLNKNLQNSANSMSDCFFFAGRGFCRGSRVLTKIAGFFAGIFFAGFFSRVLILCYTVHSRGRCIELKHRLTVGCILFKI